MQTQTTTDINRLRNGRCKYTWGELRAIHEIGPFAIVEALWPDGEIYFHPYVDEKDSGNSAPTLHRDRLQPRGYGSALGRSRPSGVAGRDAAGS